MTPTPDLIDRVRSLFSGNYSGADTLFVGKMLDVDPLTALEALMWLWKRHEVERMIDSFGVARWYDPERLRRLYFDLGACNHCAYLERLPFTTIDGTPVDDQIGYCRLTEQETKGYALCKFFRWRLIG